MRITVPTLALAGLIGSLLIAPFPKSTATAAATQPTHEQQLSGTVTLITGDRVELTPGAPPRVIPAEGRKSIGFRISAERRVRVIPTDAVALLAAGKLDPRLFDVTTLLEFEYDDAKRANLPLIVQRAASNRKAGAELAGTSNRRELPSIAGFSILESKRDSTAFWNSLRQDKNSLRAGVTKVWLNGIRRTTLDHSVPQIGAPSAWSAGLTGRGVKVAVVDSGIDAQHPDLVGKVAAAKNFVDQTAGDEVGHGTHVASTVTGTGAASNGSYRGVAPDVTLLDAKACGPDGCPEDAILAGIDWAVVEQHATVVNLSLGGADSPGEDPLEHAVNTLSAQYGTLFVVSAGNNGAGGSGTIGSPGSAAAALTVGAVDREDTLAEFSSRGPTVGETLTKPDLTAPGVEIVAAKAAGTEPGRPVGDQYVELSGTSMAAPHVTGAAAILLQQHPDWTGAEVKAALMASSKATPGVNAFDQGAGRVDVAQAIKQQVVASPASISFGLATWPHEDDPVQTKTITYRNTGSTPVTLELEPQDQPAGLFTVTPRRLVVPAGGSADATLTADTRASTVPIGKFSGQLLATGDGTRVSTPFGVEKESERYGVKLTNIGRDGKAPLQHVTFFDRIGDCGSDPYCGDYVYGEGTSTAELRLPPGEYTVVDFSTTTGTDWTMLAYSTLDHRADRSLVLDARKAKPVEMSVPKATARLMEQSVVVARDMRRGPDSVFTYFQPGDAENPIYITELGKPAADPAQVVSVAYGRFAEPGPAGDFANSPYDYNLADYRQGRALDGVRLRTRQEQYATVKASYATDTAEPRTALTSHGVRPTGSAIDYSLPPTGARELASALPVRRAEYYLADGFKWSTTLATLAEDGQLWTWLFNSERSVYRRGRTYHQEWNKGVLGPRLTLGPVTPNGLARGAQRDGDRLLFGLSLRSDSNPLHMNEPKLPAGSAKLYRNGELIKDLPRASYFAAEVPADEATYRLDSRVEMPGTDVSPILESSWTFRSGHVEGTASLPLMAVHFQPVLDDHNHARAGRFVLPITVQRQPGAPAADVKTLQVETSTDDGKTWHPAKVARTAHGWQTTVTNPPNGAVSLRAKASDTNGNEVTQTFILGYLVRG